MDDSYIIGVKNLRDGENIADFFKRFYASELARDFGVYRLDLWTLRPMRPAVHAVFEKVVPGVQIKDAVTDKFHDRYWIDADTTRGVIVGTSLNGIGKKVSMIDYASPGDSSELVRLAAAFI